MALCRKPKIGQVLVEPDGSRSRVTGFWPDLPGICCIEDVDAPDDPDLELMDINCFIWRHADGELNQHFTEVADGDV